MKIRYPILLALPMGLPAADLTVDVLDYRFNPEVLSVEVGDTVTWTNLRGVHNVAADSGLFDSGPPAAGAWSFSHTFNQVNAEILYRCEEHSGMIGGIEVTDPTAFDANFGMTGSWWNALTRGQGFSFEMVPEGDVLVVYWFTYAVSGGLQQWLLGQGPMSNNQVTLTFVRPTGGKFNDPQEVTEQPWGSATITFDSCDSASMTYQSDLDGVSGTISLERLTPDLICASGGLIDE